MTEDQIYEAIRQLHVQCELKQPNYEMVSVRSALNELGYNSKDIETIILFIAKGGFAYCMDHTIAVNHPDNPKKYEYPSQDVCYWGPDQLASRLSCLNNIPYDKTFRHLNNRRGY